MPRPRMWAAVALAITIGLGGLTAIPASAHDELVSSAPSANATLPTAPTEVTLRFSAALKPEAVQLAVVDPGGNSVRVGDPTINGATVVQAIKPNLPAATYRISYRVISRDGHPVSGVRSFVVQNQSPGQSPTTAIGSPGAEAASGGDRNSAGGEDHKGWLWLVIGGVVAIVTVSVVVALISRRRRTETPTASPGR